MILSDIMSGGATSTILKDPTAAVSSTLASAGGSISGLSSGPLAALGAAGSSLTTAAGSIQSQMATEMESLKTRLPLVDAAQAQTKSIGLLSGQVPSGSDGGTAFNSAFQSITTLPKTLAASQTAVTSSISSAAAALPAGVAGSTDAEKLANFAATAPSPTIADATTGLQITNPAYTAWQATHSDTLSSIGSITSSLTSHVASMTASVTSLFSAQSAAVAASIQGLKDIAFASFAAADHAPCTTAILEQCTQNTSDITVEKDMADGGTTAIINRQVTSSSAKSPATITEPDVPTEAVRGATQDQVDSMKESLKTQKAKIAQLKTTSDASYAVCKKWTMDHGYEAAYNAYSANPTEANKASMTAISDAMKQTDAYAQHMADYSAYTSACYTYNASVANYNTSLKFSANGGTYVEPYTPEY